MNWLNQVDIAVILIKKQCQVLAMAGTSLTGDLASKGPAGLSCLCTHRFMEEQIKVLFGLQCVLVISMWLCLSLE